MDISDPTQPKQIGGVLDTGCCGNDVHTRRIHIYKQSSLLFLGETASELNLMLFGDKGICTLQIPRDNEAAPRVLSKLKREWNNTNASLCHTSMKGVVFAYCNRGLFAIDIRNLSDIREISCIESQMSCYNSGSDMVSIENLLLCVGRQGLNVIDVSDPVRMKTVVQN